MRWRSAIWAGMGEAEAVGSDGGCSSDRGRSDKSAGKCIAGGFTTAGAHINGSKLVSGSEGSGEGACSSRAVDRSQRRSRQRKTAGSLIAVSRFSHPKPKAAKLVQAAKISDGRHHGHHLRGTRLDRKST